MQTPKSKQGIETLLSIMKLLRSPDGCPWDRQQTMESLLPTYWKRLTNWPMLYCPATGIKFVKNWETCYCKWFLLANWQRKKACLPSATQ